MTSTASKSCKDHTPSQSLRGFSDVDHSHDPHLLVAYLESTNDDAFVLACKRQAIELLDPRPGEHILDIGCGLGHASFEIADRVGVTGRVTAIDSSEIMIREAKQRSSDMGNHTIDFRVEDAHRMTFENHSFDGCLAINTLMHCARLEQVLSEIRRVLKPQGRIVVLEPDWQTLELSTGNPRIDDIAVAVLRQSITNSAIGQQLPAFLRALGFEDIRVDTGTIMTKDLACADHAWKIRESIVQARDSGSLLATTAAEVSEALMHSSEDGCFFGAMTGYVLIGKTGAS
jgi:SAM-dependent methyltransferase